MGTRSPHWFKDFQAVGQEKPGPSDFLVLQVATSADGFVQHIWSLTSSFVVCFFYFLPSVWVMLSCLFACLILFF